MEPGFFCMDCMEAMKQFPDGFFDLAIVDPPYGISITARHKAPVLVWGGARPFGGWHRRNGEVGQEAKANRQAVMELLPESCGSTFYHPFDDSSAPDEGYFMELQRVAKKQIIWGGNFFLDILGKASCMIVWDKKRRGMDQADCEIAWTNLPGQSRIFEWKWNGMLQQDMKHKEKRIHPTQKPVALYAWLLEKYAKHGMKILDTHVGSASSLIACHRAGLQYWGFEIDPVYYEQAKARLAAETAQTTMFQSKEA